MTSNSIRARNEDTFVDSLILINISGRVIQSFCCVRNKRGFSLLNDSRIVKTGRVEFRLPMLCASSSNSQIRYRHACAVRELSGKVHYTDLYEAIYNDVMRHAEKLGKLKFCDGKRMTVCYENHTNECH